MSVLSEKAKLFLAQKPTLIGIVGGQSFYEHPIYGDESTLVCITSAGFKINTDFWELPTAEEAIDVADWIAKG